MNDGMHNQAQLVMRASRGNRADLADLFESKGIGCEGIAGSKAASEARPPAGANVERKGAGKTGGAIAAAWPDSLRALLPDEEFYEVFSEIRLP